MQLLHNTRKVCGGGGGGGGGGGSRHVSLRPYSKALSHDALIKKIAITSTAQLASCVKLARALHNYRY